jgi:tetratricopeptide (TPR) repeat protein
MKQLALALMLSCVVGTHAWTDAKDDCHQRGNPDRALKGCTRYIEENQVNGKDLATAHFSRGYAYMHKGDMGSAIADLSRAIELDPQNASTYYGRGFLYFNKGEHERAIEDFTKAIELLPNADARRVSTIYQMRGLAYEKTHNADLAIADFRRALAINPDQRGSKGALRRLGVTP